ncbi:general stress protein [Naasia sp. SYSU D00057]|uniref:general stress protein n=1 Tax=Naasia sp. SYSU D00057 TaxID=2817380 RepID=UPI001B3118F4|nr:general stress protein [Naasia sp. SYSU D00057]
MTTPSPFSGRQQVEPALPRGEVVGTYETYTQAQQAVDRLVKADFSVKDVSIVGNDLKSVEHVTGRLTYAKAAGAGALSGLWMGLFIGVVLVLFSPASPGVLGVGLAAAIIGAGFGMLFGIASYAVTRRVRDFTSTRAVIASNYTLVVQSDSAVRAQSILGGSGPMASTGDTQPPNLPPTI